MEHYHSYKSSKSQEKEVNEYLVSLERLWEESETWKDLSKHSLGDKKVFLLPWSAS